MPTSRVHHRTCNLCEAMCGIRIELEGDEIRRIAGDPDDPFSRGHICPKAAGLKAFHDDPDRLRAPMRKGPNGWREVGWDEALDEAASRLDSVQSAHGRDALGIYVGNPAVHNTGALLYGPLVLRALRTKNRFSATSVDQLPHMLAAYLMFGHQLLLPIPDIDRTDHLLVLGANPLVSNGSLMTAPDIRNRLKAIRERGGRIVVIDPRRTETAEMADAHHFIRPGTDAWLLLAMVHVLFAEGVVDPGHLEARVDGLEKLRAAVAPFTPERAAEQTGIEASVVRTLALELARAERAVCYGRIGVSTQSFGSVCQWAINALNLLTANLDRPGGAMFTEPALDVVGNPKLGVGRGSLGRWKSRVRGLPEFGGELPVAALAEEIETPGDGRIRALVTVAGNPVLSTPNGQRLEKALGQLDFMVSIDPYLNETTRHADLILPPSSPLERSHYDVVFHVLAVRNTAKYAPPLFERPENARHDWEILNGLHHRLERRRGRYAKAVQAAAIGKLGPDRLLDLGLRLGPHRLSVGRLRKAPHGIDLGPLRPCLLDRMPEGKRIELAPGRLVDDLARLEAQADAPSNGTLRLIGRRHLRSNNSWMHNVPKLVGGTNRCTLLMNPEDVDRLGLADGGAARVRSRVAEVTVEVEATDAMMPGVVSLPHGFGHHRPGTRLRVASETPGTSLNDLTDELALDEASGNAALSGVEVEVAPVA